MISWFGAFDMILLEKKDEVEEKGEFLKVRF